MIPPRVRRWMWTAAILLLPVVAVAGWIGYSRLLRQEPQVLADDSALELFKYGSIGAENQDGLPYWIWLVLPRVFPEYLPGPGGYASFGLVWEEGRAVPVGFSVRRIGPPRVGINCAFCHTATVRAAATDKEPRVYMGAASPTFDPQRYQRFLIRCAQDPRFNSRTILAAIARETRLDSIDRALYRYLVIPLTRRGILRRAKEFKFAEGRTDWGPGRIDPMNPIRVRVLKMEVADADGLADIMPIWNMRRREKMSLHWDGLIDDLTEGFRESAIDNGATRKSIPLETMRRIQEWALDLPPPAYPFAIDAALAERGAATYRARCADCHAFDGARTGKVLPLAEAGTDPHRALAWSREAADAYNEFGRGYPWDFNRFQAPGGYLNGPLDGIWLRAPYLHNGSVPTLADLLEPPEKRPATFLRGCDVFDQVKVGFLSAGAGTEACGRVYDTARAGNGNGGHLYGTTLAAEEKRALLEYLKTL